MSQPQPSTADYSCKKPFFMLWTAPAFLLVEAGGFLAHTYDHAKEDAPGAFAAPVPLPVQPPSGSAIDPELQGNC
jgi:hypothetical protein